MNISADKGLALTHLNSLEIFARALLVSITPLIALKALGNKESVAHAYLVASLFTLCITLNFNRLESWLARRWVLTLAGAMLGLFVSFTYSGHPVLFTLGIGFRSAAASMFIACLTLYIMDYVARKQLALIESRRMAYSGIVWLIGPFLGSWLWGLELYFIPFALSLSCVATLLTFFWYLRLDDNPAIPENNQQPVKSAFKAVPRYFSQKYLRIAYFITLIRAVFWSSLFIYGPIYVIESGLPTWAAGVLLSGVSGVLLFSQFIRRLAERFTTRLIITMGFFMGGIAQIGLGILGEPIPIGVALWCFGAIGMTCIDVLCNLVFMRLVKPYERTDMTMVFSTWREAADLIAPLTITLLTLLFPFWVYYVVLGLVLLGMSVIAMQLPKRL